MNHAWESFNFVAAAVVAGAFFLLNGFSGELRTLRPFSSRRVFRSRTVDELEQLACFLLGALYLFFGANAFVLSGGWR